jgi:hypothetical protein
LASGFPIRETSAPSGQSALWRCAIAPSTDVAADLQKTERPRAVPDNVRLVSAANCSKRLAEPNDPQFAFVSLLPVLRSADFRHWYRHHLHFARAVNFPAPQQ